VGRITDLSWYIRRERILKNEIIKLHHKQVAAKLLDDFYNPMVGIPEEIRRWAGNIPLPVSETISST
jgi:hypothetical protein